MSLRLPLTLVSGQTQRMPSGDLVDPAALPNVNTMTGWYDDSFLAGCGDLGGAEIAWNFSPYLITASNAMTSGALTTSMVHLARARTLNGVLWYQATKGSYTANNNNRVGLYSYSGGTMTLVASCANDSTLWQTASSNTVGSKPFSVAYPAAAGTYFVMCLYSASSAGTVPVLGSRAALLNAAVAAMDLTNSAKFQCTLTGQTDLPSPTQAMSGMSTSAGGFWVGVY